MRQYGTTVTSSDVGSYICMAGFMAGFIGLLSGIVSLILKVLNTIQIFIAPGDILQACRMILVWGIPAGFAMLFAGGYLIIQDKTLDENIKRLLSRRNYYN